MSSNPVDDIILQTNKARKKKNKIFFALLYCLIIGLGVSYLLPKLGSNISIAITLVLLIICYLFQQRQVKKSFVSHYSHLDNKESENDENSGKAEPPDNVEKHISSAKDARLIAEDAAQKGVIQNTLSKTNCPSCNTLTVVGKRCAHCGAKLPPQ